MNFDLNLLSKIIKNQDYLTAFDRGIRERHIKGDVEKAIFRFIVEFHREHRSVPSEALITERFEIEIPDVADDIGFWINEVKNRTLFEDINELSVGVAESVRKDDPKDAFKKLGDFVKEQERLSAEETLLTSVYSPEVRHVAWQAYLDAKAGKRGISTPWDAMDNWTMGWWPKDMSFIVARSGIGKCEAKGTKHLMYDGSIKNVEDLMVGDLLMGPDSRPRTVLSLARGQEEMFDIVPTKGERWGCNRSHILSLRCSSDVDSVHRKGLYYEYSVDEFLKLPKRVQSVLKLWKTGVRFKEKPVKVDPYWVGLWLGDGTCRSSGDIREVEITKDEPELIQYYQRFCEKNGYRLNRIESQDKCAKYSFSSRSGARAPLKEFLSECHEKGVKRIPRDYLINSEEVRMNILAGLLDSDGHLCGGRNTFEISIKDDELREDVLFLARSLGFMCTWRRKKSSIKATGFEGWYNRVFIFGDTDKIPTKIERKKARPRKQIKNHLVTGFSLKSKGQGDYYGFTLDKDGLYLLWDFTVSHNTWAAILIADAAVEKSKAKVLLISCEMTKEDIIQRYYAIKFKKNYASIRRGRLSFFEEQEYKRLLDEFESQGAVFDVKDGSQGLHITDIERTIAKSDAEFVIIDSCYRIKAAQKARDRFDNMAMVADDIKMIAQKYGKSILCTTQVTRDGGKKKEGDNMSQDDVALSDVINWNSTNVFGLKRSDEEKKSGHMSIYPIKVRESANSGDPLVVNWDFEHMIFGEKTANDEVPW